MLTTITSILPFIAATISLICVIIMNIIVDYFIKQAKEYEAEVERLKAAMENTTSKEK